MSTSSAAQSSKKARASAARLAAVQAVYQMMGNAQKADAVIADFRDRRLGKPIDGQAMVMPERELFEEIVTGVETIRPELETLLIVPGQQIPAEPLLRAIHALRRLGIMRTHRYRYAHYYFRLFTRHACIFRSRRSEINQCDFGSR